MKQQEMTSAATGNKPAKTSAKASGCMGSGRPHSGRSGRPMVEPLEGRELMSAALSAAGVVPVTGTASDDAITVSQNGSNVTVNDRGVVRTFAAAKVASVTVKGMAGNDTLRGGATFAKPLTIDGGD